MIILSLPQSSTPGHRTISCPVSFARRAGTPHRKLHALALSAALLAGMLPSAHSSERDRLVVHQGDSYQIATPGFASTFNRSRTAFESIRIQGTDVPVHIRLRLGLGPGNDEVETTMRSYSEPKEHDQIRFQAFHPIGVSQHTITVRPTYIRYQVVLESNQAERQLIECSLEGLLQQTSGWHFWDGDYDAPKPLNAIDQPIRANSISIEGKAEMGQSPGQGSAKGLFPACAIYNDRAGVGLGLSPDFLCSYYGSSYSPGKDGGRAAYMVRRVLEPMARIEFDFVILPVDAAWGVRSIVDCYYQTAPARFDRDPSVHPDAYGLFSISHIANVLRQGDRFIEICRRGRVGALHLWGSSPCGDVEDGDQMIRPRGKFYTEEEPAILYYDFERGAKKLVSLSQQDLKDAIATANVAALPVNYIITVKGDARYATDHFPEAISRLPNGQRRLWPRNAGMLWAAMNPGFNSYGRSVRSDIFHRIEEYRSDGIYFDNGAVNWRDYGDEKMFPAFDDEGKVYTNVGLSQALLLDDIRARHPRVHLDPGEFLQYPVTVRADSHLANLVAKFKEYPRNARYLLGKKPMYFGLSIFFPGMEDRTAKRVPHLRHPVPLLNAFRWGSPPWMNDTDQAFFGIDPVEIRSDAKLLGAVFGDLAQAGWEPLPYIRTDNAELWAERFQRGTDSLYFVVINPTSQPQKTTATIDAAIHPHGLVPVCVPYVGGKSLVHRFAGGRRSVSLELQLKPHSVLVLRGIAWMEPPEGGAAITAAFADDRARISVVDGAASPVRWTLNSLRETLDTREPELPAATHLDLTRGRETTVSWASRYPLLDAGCSLDEVRFLREAGPVSIIADANNTAAFNNARRIRGFLIYQAELLGRSAIVEIVSSAAEAKHPSRVLIALESDNLRPAEVDPRRYLHPAPPRNAAVVALNPSTLLLTGKSEWDLRLALNKYLDTIEVPFPYEGARLDSILMQN